MSDIGYYTLPVLPSFRGITADIQSQLDKAFKGAGENAGKIMGQSAADTFAKDPSLSKAIATAPASMDGLTKATDKQTQAVGRLDVAQKKLSTTVGTPDQQTQVIAVQDKQTDAIRKTETQVKQSKTAHDELAQSIKKVNDEQARGQSITTGGGKGLGDSLKDDLGKALGGDSSGAWKDLGDQLSKTVGEKLRGTLSDTVKDVTGMRVDSIIDKIDSGAKSVGVDVAQVLTTARDQGIGAARDQVLLQAGTKGISAGANFARGGIQDATGIDIGGMPGMQELGAAAQDWANSGGTDQVLDFLTGGGIGRAAGGARGLLGALRQPGGIRGALGAGRDALQGANFGNILGNVNDFTGGGAQPIIDAQSGVTDLAEGLLGGTAAEKFLPAIADAALPVILGGAGGKYLSDKFEHGPARSRIEGAYDDTGTATNSFERNMESIPGIGSFLGPSDDLRNANMHRRDAQIGSGESFYTSVFGNDRSGIGAGTGGGGGGPTSTQEMNVDAGVATISAGSVSLGGSISLPAGLTLGGSGGGGGGRAAASSLGSASPHKTGEDSLYSGDSGGSYFAKGGPIGTDTIPLWGSPGEWMVPKSAADKYGPTVMSSIVAGHFADGGPIDGTRVNPHTGPKGSANDPIYTMPSSGYTHAIAQQAPPGKGAGGASSLLGGGGFGDSFNAAGGISGLMGIGQQAASDMIPGFGNIGSDPLVQSGMNMMQAALGMAMQPGGLQGALTSDAAGMRTFGGMFGMAPQVAGMPHPDDMAASPGDAAFGDVLSNRVGGGESPNIDQSTTLNVTGYSAQEVGDQVYRAIGSTGVPNTPRVNTNVQPGN